MGSLSKRVALVTGAGRGIGRAIALQLAANGATVGVLARDAGAGAAVRDAIRRKSGESESFQCDVTSHSAVENAVNAVRKLYGKIDILINNAGTIQPIAAISDTRPEDWKSSLSVNLLGAYYCIRSSLPHMVARNSGVIINLSSGAAHKPFEGWSAYCAGKAGLAMLTQAIHLEYATSGIRAIGFAPGVVDTSMQSEIRASRVNPVSQLSRESLASPDKPATAVVWLCSDHATKWGGREVSIKDGDLVRMAGLG